MKVILIAVIYGGIGNRRNLNIALSDDGTNYYAVSHLAHFFELDLLEKFLFLLKVLRHFKEVIKVGRHYMISGDSLIKILNSEQKVKLSELATISAYLLKKKMGME